MNNIIKLTIVISIIITTLFSCTNYDPANIEAPADLISTEQFTKMLLDVRLVEVIIRQEVTKNGGNGMDSITDYYYKFVFNKYDISQERFQSSLLYYTNEPELFNEINNSIVDSLNIMKEIVRNPEIK